MTHVGYYLIGSGRRHLEDCLHYQPTWSIALRRWLLAHPTLTYLGSIVSLSCNARVSEHDPLRGVGWHAYPDHWRGYLDSLAIHGGCRQPGQLGHHAQPVAPRAITAGLPGRYPRRMSDDGGHPHLTH